MEKLHGLICVFLGIAENRMCLFIGFSENPLFTFIQLFFFFLKRFFQLFYLLFVTGNFSTLVFDGDTALLQGCQNIFERFILLADLFLCFVDDEIWKPSLEEMANALLFPGTPIRRR
mgnify:CR=1 FL=1